MYSDHQRETQFADVRSGGANAMSAPDVASGAKDLFYHGGNFHLNITDGASPLTDRFCDI
jgi:hypothetical protein